MKTTTKNPHAVELRVEANKLRNELLDPARTFSVDEVRTRTDAIAALELRAQTAAEFTPDAEVARQGGDDEIRPFRAGATDPDAPEVRTGRERAEEAQKMIRKAFGSTIRYVRAAAGVERNLSAEQVRVLDHLDTLTRSITGSTNGGEFLLPLSQVNEIFSIENRQNGILGIARTYSMPGRTLRIPYLVQDEGTSTLNRPLAGKIANVAIVGEGSTKPARTPTFGQRLLTAYKYAAITQAGDELLDDDFTGELPAEFINAVGGQVVNAMNEHMTFDGTGSSMPLGAFNANNTAILNVNRATANTFTTTDAFAMYVRHTLGPRSAWMVSRRAVAEVFNLTLNGTTLVTFLPNLNGVPEMRLLGLPVVVTDLLPTLGTKGDVTLVNPDFYAANLRQALTVESSRDYAFVEDLTTYRFIARGGGIPIPTSTYAYKVDGSGNKVDAHSPFTVLDVPAVS
jgi:HK97 family phage major capsid protein